MDIPLSLAFLTTFILILILGIIARILLEILKFVGSRIDWSGSKIANASSPSSSFKLSLRILNHYFPSICHPLILDIGGTPTGFRSKIWDALHPGLVAVNPARKSHAKYKDITQVPLVLQADLIMIFGVLRHLPPAKLHEMFERSALLLKDDGTLLVAEPDPISPLALLEVLGFRLGKKAAYAYSATEIKKALKNANFNSTLPRLEFSQPLNVQPYNIFEAKHFVGKTHEKSIDGVWGRRALRFLIQSFILTTFAGGASYIAAVDAGYGTSTALLCSCYGVTAAVMMFVCVEQLWKHWFA
ncbi:MULTISPECIES: hypothetical protein [unclassified Herbaspirillum]|uniref:hypothetical protein n=1 Tax=unclassified Herbaspirillum TaxID=2624150 RepID=UPI000E2EEB37|nr:MULTISPECIES: hypothetical protein [unclassified Herbaspirillum]RFB67537.1 hypothetical protein DZB54_20470 [Herbaspirillum sp. 3R-3a1]TFI05146.1 hypothetical protein E4P32_23435 [Herbaspirillum sp. 3R11]TFI12524.1 hypothetical protein E4P31_20930 [Herbaspirillum sp. 3R-11]TFI28323.1 hypothetical protein E4P30_08455 [Herbaspirillum sp. 3C11]